MRQNEALSATEQNQTYKNSLFLETSMQFSNRIKCDVGANKNAGQAFLRSEKLFPEPLTPSRKEFPFNSFLR
ncbi:hypothetical protein, partial [Anaerobutyricum soehngenii]|uniref:hypothetical protein n=1 Tax=Anaerobutyricum soehngenii TaxID=105843 RepID=UPI0032C00728